MLNYPPALTSAELRRRLRPFCEKHPIRRLEVFGSVAPRQVWGHREIDAPDDVARNSSPARQMGPAEPATVRQTVRAGNQRREFQIQSVQKIKRLSRI